MLTMLPIIDNAFQHYLTVDEVLIDGRDWDGLGIRAALSYNTITVIVDTKFLQLNANFIKTKPSRGLQCNAQSNARVPISRRPQS